VSAIRQDSDVPDEWKQYLLINDHTFRSQSVSHQEMAEVESRI